MFHGIQTTPAREEAKEPTAEVVAKGQRSKITSSRIGGYSQQGQKRLLHKDAAERKLASNFCSRLVGAGCKLCVVCNANV